jgi:hypothetical protein
MGDLVAVEGTYALIGGYDAPLMLNPTFYAVYGKGQVAAPVASSCIDISSTNYGKFVTLSDVIVDSVTPGTLYSSYIVHDGTGSATIYYDTNSTISDAMLPLPSVGTTVTVTGIIEQEQPWTFVVDLKPWNIVQVSVTPSSVRLVPTQTQLFTASGGTGPYVWISSDTAVGTIDTFGVFTAIANGSCTITATDVNGYYAYASVIVQATNAPLATELNRTIYRRESFSELFE